MKTLFCGTDDVNGDSQIEVWTNGSGDLHVLIVLGSVYQDNVPLTANSAGNHVPDLDKIQRRPKWWQKGGRVQ